MTGRALLTIVCPAGHTVATVVATAGGGRQLRAAASAYTDTSPTGGSLTTRHNGPAETLDIRAVDAEPFGLGVTAACRACRRAYTIEEAQARRWLAEVRRRVVLHV